jgi:hypothetical protein
MDLVSAPLGGVPLLCKAALRFEVHVVVAATLTASRTLL